MDVEHDTGTQPPTTTQGSMNTAENTSKKRKASTNEAGRRVKKSKVNPYGTMLKQLLEMPVDVLFEICGHLDPSDLLSLGRVSKEYRNLVMDPEFKCVWAHCRAQYPGSPECPDDISEPTFAELIFGHGCQVCGKKRQHIHVIWGARKRLCTNCIADTFVSLKFVQRLKLPPAVCKVIPLIYIRSKNHYSQVHATSWANEYHALETVEQKKSWEEAKLCQWKKVQEHANLCRKFNWTVRVKIGTKASNEIDERTQKIVELVKSMGWGDELEKMADSLPQNMWQIVKICQKPLTEKSLATAREIIQGYMVDVRKMRLAKERGEKYEARLRTLKNVYEESLGTGQSRTSRPPVSYVFALPRIKTIVADTPLDTEVTAEDFAINQDTISGILQEVNDAVKSKLLTLVHKGYEGGAYDSATVLDLASTVFANKSDRYTRRFFNSPTTMTLRSIRTSPTKGVGSVEHAAYVVLDTPEFNNDGIIVFDTEGHKAVCQILTLCGLDPTTATEEQANEVDPIVECALCNDFSSGRLMMRWSFAALHLCQSHLVETDISNFCLVEGEDAVRTKKAMKDAEERGMFGRNVQTKCKHCGHLEGVVAMRAHVHTQHDVVHPTDNDWLYVGQAAKAKEHRLWPPRISHSVDSSW